MRGRTFRRRRLKKLSSPNIKHDEIYVLSKWMGDKGYKPVTKLSPKFFDGCDRGLMTKDVINPGDVIISIPQNLLVTPKSVLNSYLGVFFKKFYPKATGQEILSIFLMCERAKGRLGDWYPYISSLPTTYNIPVYFSQHIFEMLPKSIYKSAKQQYDSLKKSFSSLELLINDLITLHPTFKDNMNYEQYKWAWSTVNTRCIYMECIENCNKEYCSYHLALAPFLDLLNHNVDVKVHAGFNKNKNCYEIISCNKFKKYSQVFINYGSHDNHKLFLEYGFVIPENYNDFIAFSIDDIVSAYELCSFSSQGLSQKLKFIIHNNLLRNAVCNRDGLSWNLNIILRILTSEYDPKHWASLLHDTNSQESFDSKFIKLKKILINLKINDLKLNVSLCTNCPKECSSHQRLVSSLYSIENSILIKTLS